MNISEATREDIPALVILINNAYRGEGSKKGWTTEADLPGGKRTDANMLVQIINKQNAAILKFCNDDGAFTGCVYLEKKKNKMFVGMLTVSPTEQTKGIGKKLLSASEDYAQKQNCTSMQMTVISVRTELIHWYERRGYYKTGETIPFTSDTKFAITKQPLEFLVMEKVI